MEKWEIVVLIIVIVLGVALFISRPAEDTWIKDERGVWIKHGMPNKIPNEVAEQQQVIDKALELYAEKKLSGFNFSSQCLGTVSADSGTGYAVDIVHMPRELEDNLIENQCQDFLDGKVSRFVEIDKDGDIVRIT